MANNSIFDDLGIGASDLGFSKDPDDVARENQAELDRQQTEIDTEKARAETERKDKLETSRTDQASRSRTLLTGPGGLQDASTNVSRKTLLGS